MDLSQSRYEALRRMAAHLMRSERVGHTLGGTALVHEAYIRLAEHEKRAALATTGASGSAGEVAGDHGARPDSGDDPMALAVTVFRRVLIDHARRRGADKRPTSRPRIELPLDLVARGTTSVVDIVALGEAIERLAVHDPRHARIIEYRIFGGYTVAQVAASLGVSVSTVEQEQRRAIAWLRAMMDGGDDGH